MEIERLEVTRPGGKGKGRVLSDYRVSVWVDDKVLETDSGNGCITLKMKSMPWN